MWTKYGCLQTAKDVSIGFPDTLKIMKLKWPSLWQTTTFSPLGLPFIRRATKVSSASARDFWRLLSRVTMEIIRHSTLELLHHLSLADQTWTTVAPKWTHTFLQIWWVCNCFSPDMNVVKSINSWCTIKSLYCYQGRLLDEIVLSKEVRK